MEGERRREEKTQKSAANKDKILNIQQILVIVGARIKNTGLKAL